MTPNANFSASWLASLPTKLREAAIASLSNSAAEALRRDWATWERPNQRAPEGDWATWLILAGRGFGKTRVGAEKVRQWVRNFSLVNIIGATADDARDIMVEGESGILAVCPRHERPRYVPSKRRLEWPNGARSLIFTADEPERLRGKQSQKLWLDEIGSWRKPEAFDQAMFGLRLGALPQAIVTTTPKPIKMIRELIADPGTIVTRGSTYDNRANLAPGFFARIIKRYEGTRLGRQELNAELLDDVEGALWSGKLIEDGRVTKAPDMARIVVAIDPAVTTGEDADETGIIVAGKGVDGDAYIFRDLSCRLTSNGWGNRAVNAYREFSADRIVAEVNNGGDLVEDVIRLIDKNVSYKAVHASRGKVIRAEPISSLYEQKRVHHVGLFGELEAQMCTFAPDHLDGSPDRVDALVWALTELMLDSDPIPNVRFFKIR
ncbi:MAG TPA: terminase family protein [Bryobacteraceae bacterium]|jgi:phage terminase large subunit-like protein|nr:terminase family protein [Bryobacteraceae bacterium]